MIKAIPRNYIEGISKLILYRTKNGLFVAESEHANRRAIAVPENSLSELMTSNDLHAYLRSLLASGKSEIDLDPESLLAPIEHQEVWAAGVTYFRSRSARIEESKGSGGGDFYDRVYSADRPELFFKAVAHKVAGPGAAVRIRGDAQWSVPEPELALVINPRGEIIGYTIGNDMSSRDIEGANPLYLPQAKVYDQSCALGPGILVQREAMAPNTQISLEIVRAGSTVFSGSILLSEMKRSVDTLVEYLYRDQSFPYGCILLTGTGIIPPDNFTLQSQDAIHISIRGIGTLTNHVA